HTTLFRFSQTAVEKTLRGKVGKQTFPLRLGIPQKTRDSHFPTAATTTALRLHFKWRDDPPHGYILKWLDAPRPAPGIAYSHRILRKPFDKWHPRAHPPSGSKLRRLPGRLRARRGNGRFRALAQGILNRPIWLWTVFNANIILRILFEPDECSDASDARKC